MSLSQTGLIKSKLSVLCHKLQSDLGPEAQQSKIEHRQASACKLLIAAELAHSQRQWTA